MVHMDGWLMSYHGVSFLFAVIAIAFVVVVYFRSYGRRAPLFPGRSKNHAGETTASELEVLYARGKIDHAEYIRRRRGLKE